MSGHAAGPSMGGGGGRGVRGGRVRGGGGRGRGGGGGEAKRSEAKRLAHIEAMEANRVYQATRLYSTPPVYGESDERRETGDYGLTHMVITITKRRCFAAIIRYLKPSEAALVKQARKMFGSAVEAEEEQIVRHLHALHFAHVPLSLSLPSTIGEAAAMAAGGGGGGTCFSWTRYLHELVANKSHKLLLMGGLGDVNVVTNFLDMLVIDDEGTKISWQACAPMIKKRWYHSAYYCQGQVLSVSSSDGNGADGQGTSERYDVLSQTAVELEHKLPIPNLFGVEMAELDGKAFAMSGRYRDAATDRVMYSDRVYTYCLDNKRHRGQEAGTWIEQEARLITARSNAAAAAYQGKMWVAGGHNNGNYFSSIEVLDPLIGSWQAAGNLTKARGGNIALFAIKDDLFAAGCTHGHVMWIEMRNAQTGAWQLVSWHKDFYRYGCALAACGSTIYFLGGNFGSSTKTSWNSFDTRTTTWASQQEHFQDEATRQLPRGFSDGRAVCITPSEQLSGLGTWTSYPNLHREEEEEEEA